MDVKKIWTWIKIIVTLGSILGLIIALLAGYFYYKENILLDEETDSLETLKEEFKTKMDKVK